MQAELPHAFAACEQSAERCGCRSLRLAGILRRARALMFGEMWGCDEANGQPCALDVIRGLTGDCEGPIVAGFPSGHTTGPSWTLPLGVRVRIVTAPHPAVVVEESPVE